jgi:hypothetical protein
LIYLLTVYPGVGRLLWREKHHGPEYTNPEREVEPTR